MAVENINDRYSIKNLLFTKALPNYVPPVGPGFKLFPCIDCGDKYIFESTYESHIRRKSMLITYMCRLCVEKITFYNRCNLLQHIRSHRFKTATISISDLNVEPLPLSHFNLTPQTEETDTTHKQIECIECKTQLSGTGQPRKDRKAHYMRFTNEVYTCPICLFALPTTCGLRAHIRLHLNRFPFYCPECGSQLPKKNVQYPYNHDCDGFKMMRATARLKCPVSTSCSFIHPSDYKDHMNENHMKKVYKCQSCVVACFSDETMRNHLSTHSRETKALIFYQCELCPVRLVIQNQMDQHLNNHLKTTVFPCWTCGAVCKNGSDLLVHHIRRHKDDNQKSHQVLSSIVDNFNGKSNTQLIYRVVKRCDQCLRTFKYNCVYSDMSVLPNMCPYKCSTLLKSKIECIGTKTTDLKLICHICKNHMLQDWEVIKKHYATHHKQYRCLDINLKVPRLNVREYMKNNKKRPSKSVNKVNKTRNIHQRNNKTTVIDCTNNTCSKDNVKDLSCSTEAGDELTCNKCGYKCDSKDILENHIITHRDPCMAYQCMECGESFVVKPSFSTHLVLEHKITDVDEYINIKPCYNPNALSKLQQNEEINEPVRENQCRICREQFENSEGLEKHFRVHGMAFLMKNNTPKVTL